MLASMLPVPLNSSKIHLVHPVSRVNEGTRFAATYASAALKSYHGLAVSLDELRPLARQGSHTDGGFSCPSGAPQ